MNRVCSRLSDARAVSAVEFALVAPVLIAFVVGTAQLGRMFFANTDLRNAVAVGARLASIYPRPEDETIVRNIEAQVMGLQSEHIRGPFLEHGTTQNGKSFIEISMSYSVPLDFIVFDIPPVTLTERRRVFVQPTAQ